MTQTVKVIVCVLLGTLVVDVLIAELRPSCSLLGSTEANRAVATAWYRHKQGLPAGAPEAGTAPRAPAAPATEYEAAARSNLTAYAAALLTKPPELGNKTFPKLWSLPAFSPITTCPPERPLTKYGGRSAGGLVGDGAKLLCQLSGELQQDKCLIYSIGSMGEHGDIISGVMQRYVHATVDVTRIPCMASHLSHKVGTGNPVGTARPCLGDCCCTQWINTPV